MSKQQMPETMYRASRCCRVLGNPTAYLLLRSLDRCRKTPTDLSREMDISLPAVSATLRHLRQLELVRYETHGRTKVYWVKDRKVLTILRTLEDWVEAMREKKA
jgi:Mn-dependent DtxR family transcriptional regulator